MSVHCLLSWPVHTCGLLSHKWHTPGPKAGEFLLTSKLYILSILPFKVVHYIIVSLLLRITAVQMSVVAATECEFVHGRPAWYTDVSCLCCRNERMCVNTCVNKSLVQALESCPSNDVTLCICCFANLSNFSCENSNSAGLVNTYMDNQKLDAILREPYSYYGSASVPKWPQKQSQSI